MASQPDSPSDLTAVDFNAMLGGRDDLAWSGPGDLSRMSREAFAADLTIGRTRRSQGRLRFWGPRVPEHAVGLDEIGGVLGTFQRAATAIGAALEGITSARGVLPTPLLARMKLLLEASPAPGSLIVTVVPQFDPSVELYPDGDVPMIDDQRPLADRSLEELLTVLGSVDAQTSAFISLRPTLGRYGPRAASALRAFARIIADDGLNLDLTWAEPNYPTTRARVTAASARFIVDEIGRGQLDTDETDLEGVIRTLSDLRPLDIEVAGGRVERVQPGDEPPPLSDLNVGDRVRAHVSVSIEQRIGGDEVTTYTLMTITRLESGT